MYYYEKDYIMRLIHGIAQMLAYLYFGKKGDTLPAVMGQEIRENIPKAIRDVTTGELVGKVQSSADADLPAGSEATEG